MFSVARSSCRWGGGGPGTRSESGRPVVRVGAGGCSGEAVAGGAGSVLGVSRQGSWTDCKGEGRSIENQRITQRFWLSCWADGSAIYRDGDTGGGGTGFQAQDRHQAALHTSPPGWWPGDWLCVAQDEKWAKHPGLGINSLWQGTVCGWSSSGRK